MGKRLILIALVWMSSLCAIAQSERSPALLNPADTSQFLYEHTMRYVGSSTHVDPNYQYVLEHLANLLKKNKHWTLHVRGHVCCGPSEKISKMRAKRAFNYLVDLGVPCERMTYKGYSDKMPLAFPEKTEEDQEINRRVDFVIHR